MYYLIEHTVSISLAIMERYSACSFLLQELEIRQTKKSECFYKKKKKYMYIPTLVVHFNSSKAPFALCVDFVDDLLEC